MGRNNLIISIDGNAGSGKSTTARLLAERLSFFHIDTGAMYRAAAYGVMQSKIDIDDRKAVEDLVRNLELLLRKENGMKVFIGNIDVTENIRDDNIADIASRISSYKGVREELVKRQRELGRRENTVIEGRDIGTVVFPDADYKFFFTADIEERARRRYLEYEKKGEKRDISKIVEDMRRRDQYDTTRSESPLKQASDAIVVDTTQMTIDEQISYILEKIGRVEHAEN